MSIAQSRASLTTRGTFANAVSAPHMLLFSIALNLHGRAIVVMRAFVRPLFQATWIQAKFYWKLPLHHTFRSFFFFFFLFIKF